MRVRLLVRQCFEVLLHRGSTIKDASLHLGHVLAETCVLVLDLVGQLASVAHDQDGTFARDWLDLLKGGKDKYCCLTKTGFGLAKYIGS